MPKAETPIIETKRALMLRHAQLANLLDLLGNRDHLVRFLAALTDTGRDE